MLGRRCPGPAAGGGAASYRDWVLALMRALAAQGATRCSARPAPLHGDGNGGLGGAKIAQVGWLCAGGLHPATELAAVGNPFITSRVIRVRYREWISRLTVLGIPASASA